MMDGGAWAEGSRVQSTLVLYVNGTKVTEPNPDPTETLLTYLREKLLLPGSKLGCGEGGCGACTVCVSKMCRETGKIRHWSANACLLPVVCCHGLAITTVEGIGNMKKMHPIQERLAASHGTQCGFCTPGFVMSMYTLLRNHPKPTQAQIHKAIEGNLCRCTGYRPILDGLGTFSEESWSCPMGELCCKTRSTNDECKEIVNEKTTLYNVENFQEANADQEIIFPNSLQLSSELDESCLHFSKDGVCFFRPNTLQQLMNLKKIHPEAKLVVGNTEIGIETRIKQACYPVLIQVGHIKELCAIEATSSGVRIGASGCLADVELFLKENITQIPVWQSRGLQAVLDMLKYFAGSQIRNVACLAGNIATASPISDLNPVLVALGAQLEVATVGNEKKTLVMDTAFFISYRKTKLDASDVILSIFIPYTKQNEYVCSYKQAKRKEDDIATVNSCMKVTMHDVKGVVQEAVLVYGGMAPYTIAASNTAEAMVGRCWDEELLSSVTTRLSEELQLPYDTPGGRVEYRLTLCISFFFKFFLHVAQHCEEVARVRDVYDYSLYEHSHTPVQGVQIYEGRSTEVTISPRDLIKPPASHCKATLGETAGNHEAGAVGGSIGEPVAHLSAIKHTTGEAVYVEDMPRLAGEMCVGFVLSSRPHARIVAVDTAPALQLPGVIGYVDHHDIPGNKEPCFGADLVFALDEVLYQGHTIGIIVAETKQVAQRAASLVKVTYEDLPYILTIEDAIKAESYFGPPDKLSRGDFASALAASRHVISGEVKVGGQEHFYLETQSSAVVPQEDGGVEAYVSTQATDTCQGVIARILDVPYHKVTVRTRRMGGAFGGKETHCNIVLLPLVVAANKYKRPVRCMLDRQNDMKMTGRRHPVLARYQVGFNDDGEMKALCVDYYSNAGCTEDMSLAVMQRVLLTADSVYKLQDFTLTGYSCKTNLPSNTAFRGFGSPQAAFVIETIIDHMAATLRVDSKMIREVNMYRGREATHYGQVLDQTNTRRCYNQVARDCDYDTRKKEIDEFNLQHRWVKQGICINAAKFLMGIPHHLYNQGAALVNIYKDGSVLLHHAGTEMGQGLYTKLVQIASQVLQIPINLIQTQETSTTHVPNAVPTVSSMGSDIQGMAVKKACEALRDRLQPIKEKMADATWSEWISAAIDERVNLSAVGFHRHESPEFDWNTGTGEACIYSSYGASASHVQIDCLTGDHQVLRTDIVMDVGKSLNPAIDIGQIEGAFMQGYGLLMLEEERYTSDGLLLTQGPGAYKIPSVGNIPKHFNVRLLKDSENEHALYSSKGIGEPPLLLATSVHQAVKEAIYAARSDEGLEGYCRLDAPATPELIRMACADRFTQLVPEYTEEDRAKPWCISP